MLKFALNINSEIEELTPDKGLPINQLGLLVQKLHSAINSGNTELCTLSSVENHGYTPNFTTQSNFIYDCFIEVHRNIQEKSINELNKNEAQYATTLKKILAHDKYLEPLDKDKKPLFRITGEGIENTVPSYNVITNVSGTISEIGSPKLDDTRHIYLDGVNYKIFINPTQEEILKNHYRNGFLDLKIKQRKSVSSGKIVSAQLLAIKVKNNSLLSDSLKKLDNSDFNFLGDVNNYNDIIAIIRG